VSPPEGITKPGVVAFVIALMTRSVVEPSADATCITNCITGSQQQQPAAAASSQQPPPAAGSSRRQPSHPATAASNGQK